MGSHSLPTPVPCRHQRVLFQTFFHAVAYAVVCVNVCEYI